MIISCPFCFYSPSHISDQVLARDDLAYHVEIFHPESADAESHFRIKIEASPSIQPGEDYPAERSASSNHSRLETASSNERIRFAVPNENDEYIECPRDCGEQILRNDLQQHVSLHLAEEIAFEDLEDVSGRDRTSTIRATQQQSFQTDGLPLEENVSLISGRKLLKSLFQKDKSDSQNQPGSNFSSSKMGQRLGKKELGPYAFENRMPSWLYKQLEAGPIITYMNQTGSDGRLTRVERIANETPGLIPHLARLLKQDTGVSKAWLCSSGVKHIFKMQREGGFCGYRNIQMQTSWMKYNRHPGHDRFPGSTPSIFSLQEMIEEAWDKGYNSIGRVETGGIIGTRKFIGTPEAQALFQSLMIKCHARSITKIHSGEQKASAYRILLEQIAEYFAKDPCKPSDKVYTTKLPPIYFQHPGHSLTIVGLEIRKNGEVNLLVFDPMFETPLVAIRYMASPSRVSAPEKVLKPFRRGGSYLKRYKSFEILYLTLVE